jgi:hypothetical protein
MTTTTTSTATQPLLTDLLLRAKTIRTHSPCPDGDMFGALVRIILPECKAVIKPFQHDKTIDVKEYHDSDEGFGDSCHMDLKTGIKIAKSITVVDHHLPTLEQLQNLGWYDNDMKPTATKPENLHVFLNMTGDVCASMHLFSVLMKEEKKRSKTTTTKILTTSGSPMEVTTSNAVQDTTHTSATMQAAMNHHPLSASPEEADVTHLRSAQSSQFNNPDLLECLHVVNLQDTGKIKSMTDKDRALHFALTKDAGYEAYIKAIQQGTKKLYEIGMPLWMQYKMRLLEIIAQKHISGHLKNHFVLYIMLKDGEWRHPSDLPLYMEDIPDYKNVAIFVGVIPLANGHTHFSLRRSSRSTLNLHTIANQIKSVQGYAAFGGGHPGAAAVRVHGKVLTLE